MTMKLEPMINNVDKRMIVGIKHFIFCLQFFCSSHAAFSLLDISAILNLLEGGSDPQSLVKSDIYNDSSYYPE